MPTVDEVSRRWSEIYKTKAPQRCEKLGAQFPNIYRILSTSFDEILQMMHNKDIVIKNLLARVYIHADCSFLENLPRSITEDQCYQAICTAIGKSKIALSSIYIQLHKKAGIACVLVTGMARLWSMHSFVTIDNKIITKKQELICRIRLFPIPDSSALNKIIHHPKLAGKVLHHKLQGESLVLELSDKETLNEQVTSGAFRIDDKLCLRVEAYLSSLDQDADFIDEDSWYETDMLQYQPDIMQFVADPKHPIFSYKWNAQIWIKQFQRVDNPNHAAAAVDKPDLERRGSPNDKIRHQLRVTVMLNTLAIVRQQSYTIDDQKVKLNISKSMKTIVYDQRSKLQVIDKLPITKAPYNNTRVDVVNEDCLLAYERLVQNGNQPLLLNMANAHSPGGGYRKGDGAQEENLFRRSDYFRSLDIGLDQWLPERSERFQCSSSGKLERLIDPATMYSMHEFGAIYTSGLTVFRRPEKTGYAFMEKPLEGVCSLAMAAYRDPKLEGNHLAPKYATGTRKKIENVFAIAYHHKHDSLVLSALGCGAFKNPPAHVAQLFNSVIHQYAGFFKTIVFAIVDDHNTGNHLNPEGNFKPFKDILDGMIATPLPPKSIRHTMFGPYRFISNDSSVSNICIMDKIPCHYGAKCSEINNQKHVQEFAHPPLCSFAAINGKCEFTHEPVHISSFIHRNRCQYGGICRMIDDERHSEEYEHPAYCSNGSACSDMKDEHLKRYRHLPLCPQSRKCISFQKHALPHCNEFRHCVLYCPHGNHCAGFHDKKHVEQFEHPFPKACPWTPFHCETYFDLMETTNNRDLSPDTQHHCLEYAHVCRLGRNCTDHRELHREKSIHIARHLCSDSEKCTNLNDEDHLNLFTHPNIADIRQLCKHADECYDRKKPHHIAKFRHPTKFELSGILLYFNLNKKTDFVQNQKRIIDNVTAYVEKNKWKPLPSGRVPREVIDYIRTVQPVHRCSPMIFESILLHGHVMSREYMENLKYPKFVANSVLQHSRIRRIGILQEKITAGKAKDYITALVTRYFETKGFLDSKLPPSTGGTGSLAPLKATPDYNSQDIPKLEAYLANNLKPNEMEAIKAKTMEIAEASMNLHMNPCGIGFGKDKDLGTDKTVFSILGPHLGHYYGDVFIVFKREILHHPDANFTIQAATSFISGNAFTSRPWLGADPGVHEERVKLYNASKLNASIPGYDYTAALELIAFTSMGLKKKSMDMDLDKIFEQARASSPARVPYKEDKRTPCKWGNKCRKMGDSQHCAQYSHQANDQPAKPPCKYGAGCHNLKSDHRAEYSHPSDGERKS
ncbi:unnamed protein product [Rotaria sp. Silwood1]|nr:unnamed protein product [Rotaria sp. Silwood1]